MKNWKWIVSMIFGGILLTQSVSANESCFDVSRALVPPCIDDSHSLFFHKGQCEKPGEIELAYCAQEEMKGITVTAGEVQVPSLSSVGPYRLMFLHGAGRMVVAPSSWVEAGKVRDCQDAEVWTGLPASFEPTEEEIGISPVTLAFYCFDQ